MEWSEKTVIVIGTGISGIAATDLLVEVGASVILYDGNDKLNPEDIKAKLKSTKGVSVVLGEQLTKELLNMVLDILKELFANVSVYVLKEMYGAFREMLEAMIEACGGLFNLSINHGTLLDTQIPDVRYADIDPGTGEIIDSDNPYIELSPEDSVDNC